MGLFSTRKLASDSEIVDLLRTMHVRMGRVEAEMEKLGSGHQSLRGFVYSQLRKLKGGDDAVPEGEQPDAPAPSKAVQSSPQAMSREELRRTLVNTGRFIPGRPPRHD